MAKSILTQERLKELLHYSIISGKFYWNKSRGNVPINARAGYVKLNRYRSIKIDQKLYFEHRLAFLYVLGIFPIDQVDHINHDRADNRWLNLRECSHHENGKNRKLGINNTSGMCGVYFHKYSQKWAVAFKRNNKVIWAGSYLTKEEAIEVRKQINIDHDFHPNHGVKSNAE